MSVGVKLLYHITSLTVNPPHVDGNGDETLIQLDMSYSSMSSHWPAWCAADSSHLLTDYPRSRDSSICHLLVTGQCLCAGGIQSLDTK